MADQTKEMTLTSRHDTLDNIIDEYFHCGVVIAVLPGCTRLFLENMNLLQINDYQDVDADFSMGAGILLSIEFSAAYTNLNNSANTQYIA